MFQGCSLWFEKFYVNWFKVPTSILSLAWCKLRFFMSPYMLEHFEYHSMRCWVLFKAYGESWSLLLAFYGQCFQCQFSFHDVCKVVQGCPLCALLKVGPGPGQRSKHQFSSHSFGMLIRIRATCEQFEGAARGLLNNFTVSRSSLLSITPQYFF